MEDNMYYKIAVKEAEKYLKDSKGFSSKEAASDTDKAFARQFNVIIALLIQLHERLEETAADVDCIKGKIEKDKENADTQLDDLINQINKLSIGEPVRPKKKAPWSFIVIKEKV